LPTPLPSSLPNGTTSVQIAVGRSGRPGAPSPTPPATSTYLALPVSDISAPPVFGHRSSRALADPSKSQLVAAMAVAGLLGALFMVWFGSRRVEATGSRVDPVISAASDGWSGAEPPKPVEAAEALTTSRTVLIESQPSGALVNVGGQAVGVTPLSTLLPVGTQQLSISKAGYATELAFIQLDAAPAGAKAVRTRVVLHESLPETPVAVAAARPPARGFRPAPRRATPHRPDAPREEAAPAAESPPQAEPAALVEEEPTPPIVEAPSRPRLLDEKPRPRLLE
jgi:hypothetical protein